MRWQCERLQKLAARRYFHISSKDPSITWKPSTACCSSIFPHFIKRSPRGHWTSLIDDVLLDRGLQYESFNQQRWAEMSLCLALLNLHSKLVQRTWGAILVVPHFCEIEGWVNTHWIFVSAALFCCGKLTIDSSILKEGSYSMDTTGTFYSARWLILYYGISVGNLAEFVWLGIERWQTRSKNINLHSEAHEILTRATNVGEWKFVSTHMA